MNLNEAEQKLKKLQESLKYLEIQLAKEEQKLKTKEEERQKILLKLKESYPDLDPEKIDEEIQKLESGLEKDILEFENDLNRLFDQIEENK